MFPDADLFVMFPQQLLADGVPIFGDDPDQPVDVFGMIPHQFREFLHLRLEMLQTPQESVLSLGRVLFLRQHLRFFRKRRH